jgi:hypothetical protein
MYSRFLSRHSCLKDCGDDGSTSFSICPCMFESCHPVPQCSNTSGSFNRLTCGGIRDWWVATVWSWTPDSWKAMDHGDKLNDLLLYLYHRQ